MMTTVTVGISALIGRIGEFTATSAKPTRAHMRKASTVAPSTALITGRCGTCIATSTGAILEPGMTTPNGGATGTSTITGTGIPTGTDIAPHTSTERFAARLGGEGRQSPHPRREEKPHVEKIFSGRCRLLLIPCVPAASGSAHSDQRRD